MTGAVHTDERDTSPRSEPLDMAALDDRLNTIAGHLNTQHALLVDCVIELLGDVAAWSGAGLHTPEQYLTWRMGLSPARARDIVTIARRADELPRCLAAFGDGELAIDQMTAIARRAPWWTDAEICDLARVMTVHQLRTTLAGYPFPDLDDHPSADTTDTDTTIGSDTDSTDPDTGDPDTGDADTGDADTTAADDDAAADDRNDGPRHGNPGGAVVPDDELWFGFDTHGRFRLELRCDPATGEILQAALAESRDRLFHDDQPDVTWVDALRDVAERSLDTVPEPSRRDRFRIDLHLHTHTGALTDATSWRLPDAIRDHLTCDGLLTPTLFRDGLPISVGRSQRTVPERTRRHIIHRDRGCRVPGCTHTHVLEVHHIIHWLDGGDTDTHNLVALCPHHHRLHHHGKLGITGNADIPGGLAFTDTNGDPITATGARPKRPTVPPPAPIKPYAHPIGERCDYSYLYFRPPDPVDHRHHFAERFGLPYPNGAN